VIFASDNARIPERERGTVVYRAAELRELVGQRIGPEELVPVHRAKRLFAE
jgi:hypothetical protein